MIRSLSLAALLALPFLLAFCNEPVFSGERDTSSRTGDVHAALFGCHTQADMEDVAENDSADFGIQLIKEQRCFLSVRPTVEGPRVAIAPVILKQWMSGPYAGPNNTRWSVWKVDFIQGITAFIAVPDAGGPHTPDGRS